MSFIASMTEFGIGLMGAPVGAGIAAIGAGLGIGKISAAANESIARQPEAASDIKGNTIVTAAFIEGVCLFAVLVGLLSSITPAKVAEADMQVMDKQVEIRKADAAK